MFLEVWGAPKHFVHNGSNLEPAQSGAKLPVFVFYCSFFALPDSCTLQNVYNAGDWGFGVVVAGIFFILLCWLGWVFYSWFMFLFQKSYVPYRNTFHTLSLRSIEDAAESQRTNCSPEQKFLIPINYRGGCPEIS